MPAPPCDGFRLLCYALRLDAIILRQSLLFTRRCERYAIDSFCYFAMFFFFIYATRATLRRMRRYAIRHCYGLDMLARLRAMMRYRVCEAVANDQQRATCGALLMRTAFMPCAPFAVYDD